MSQIQKSELDDLDRRVRNRAYKHYLYGIELKRIRGFKDASIRFDFPVTALVGPNGAGKTTVLGAAGLIYEDVPPRRFFARGGTYDTSMSGWRIEYDVVANSQPSQRTASYTKENKDGRRSKWNRTMLKRPVKVIGVNRTLPVSERTDVYKFAKNDFKGVKEEEFATGVVSAVEAILGKEAADYLRVDADEEGKYSILARKRSDDGKPGYSEFHFGAGEASIIRIVREIESVEDGALILIEEIENGLHPIATQRLVEYLIRVARRKGCQVIFTTHSNSALRPLPGDAVWSAYRGQLTQGKLDVDSLRALTGEIDARLAIFAEDKFGSLVGEVTLRRFSVISGRHIDIKGVEIHALGGATSARDQARYAHSSPVMKFPAIALLDGDKLRESGYNPATTENLKVDGRAFVAFLPGDSDPEVSVFDGMAELIQSDGKVLPRLTLSLGLDTVDQDKVRDAIGLAKVTNHDRHTVFAELGDTLDFLAEDVVSRAFVSTWALFNDKAVKEIWDPVASWLPLTTDPADVPRRP